MLHPFFSFSRSEFIQVTFLYGCFQPENLIIVLPEPDNRIEIGKYPQDSDKNHFDRKQELVCISHYNGVDVPAFKAELDKRNLGCFTISTGQARGLEGLSLIGVSDDLVKKTQERYLQHVDALRFWGVRLQSV